jgi:hypothetical protein
MLASAPLQTEPYIVLEPPGKKPRLVCSMAEKLAQRASLPGARSFDRLVHQLRLGRAHGARLEEQLEPAFAGSWLLNSYLLSTTFARWGEPDLRACVVELARGLEQGVEARAHWQQLLRRLDLGFPLAGPISKILAALVPSRVPVLSDAALSYLTGLETQSERGEEQTAGIDAFCEGVAAFWRWLSPSVRVLARHESPVSDGAYVPAQVLDRLLWFEAWGYRHFRDASVGGYFHVTGRRCEVVLPVPGAYEPELLRGPTLCLEQLRGDVGERVRVALAHAGIDERIV